MWKLREKVRPEFSGSHDRRCRNKSVAAPGSRARMRKVRRLAPPGGESAAAGVCSSVTFTAGWPDCSICQWYPERRFSASASWASSPGRNSILWPALLSFKFSTEFRPPRILLTEEILQQPFTVFCQNALGMKLHAFDRELAMAQAHDDATAVAVGGPG